MLQCLRKEAYISHLHNPGLLYTYLTLIVHLSHDLVDNHKKRITEVQQAAFPDFCAHFEKIQTVFYCGWLDKMRVRKGPGSTYELRWNSILTIVMQKLPDDIPVNTVEGLFEIIKRSFIMASAIHWKVLRVSLGWQFNFSEACRARLVTSYLFFKSILQSFKLVLHFLAIVIWSIWFDWVRPSGEIIHVVLWMVLWEKLLKGQKQVHCSPFSFMQLNLCRRATRPLPALLWPIWTLNLPRRILTSRVGEWFRRPWRKL